MWLICANIICPLLWPFVPPTRLPAEGGARMNVGERGRERGASGGIAAKRKSCEVGGFNPISTPPITGPGRADADGPFAQPTPLAGRRWDETAGVEWRLVWPPMTAQPAAKVASISSVESAAEPIQRDHRHAQRERDGDDGQDAAAVEEPAQDESRRRDARGLVRWRLRRPHVGTLSSTVGEPRGNWSAIRLAMKMMPQSSGVRTARPGER